MARVKARRLRGAVKDSPHTPRTSVTKRHEKKDLPPRPLQSPSKSVSGVTRRGRLAADHLLRLAQGHVQDEPVLDVVLKADVFNAHPWKLLFGPPHYFVEHVAGFLVPPEPLVCHGRE